MSLRTVAYTSDNDKLLLSQIDDGIYLCQKRRSPYFFSFMTEREQMVCERYLKSVCFESFSFDGGYQNAERKVLGLFFDEPEPFPVEPVEFSFRKTDKLTHRDFLGALMSLGIERETIGDILVEDGRAVVFLKSEIKDYVCSQIFKIGSVGVKINDADISQLPNGRGVEEKDYTVSSLRLDAVVAAVTGLSREKTKTLLLSGSVTHNYLECKNVSQPVNEKDIITIRGKGKYILGGVLGETKKHRIRITMIHYR